MVVQDLRIKDSAPAEGILLVYLRQRIIFEKYNSIDEVIHKLNGETLLELHMFDQDKEYRAITTTSRRFSNGLIEEVVDFPYFEGASDCFVTDSLTDNAFNTEVAKIRIINHLIYDDNGTVSVDNYRLIGEVQ